MSDEYEDDVPEVQEEGQEMINTAVPITIRPASTRSLSLSRSRSRPQSPTGDLSEGIPLTTRSAPLLGSSGQSMETLQNQGWGEAPTYLEAMSSHNPDTPLPALVPSPRPSALQRTASGFKDLITKPFAPGSFRPAQPQRQRDRGPSTSSSLLHPTTSRFSTASTSTEYPSPWASSHSLLISPPVPNSAMRASFDGSDIPRGGLNPAQMKFLSSKEAVELVGVKLEDVPAHKRRRSAQGSSSGTRRGSVLGTDDAPPPSWEQLDGERRQSEAFDRRNLATPVQLGVVTPEPDDTTTTPLTTLGADEADAKLVTATAEADRTAETGTGLVDGEVDGEVEISPLRVEELAGDDRRGK